MLPVRRLAAVGEKRVADVADCIADEFNLPPEERKTLLPSGRQRILNNRIHWAKFYMSKAGLISSPARGRFVATEEGRKLLASSPQQINVALLMKYPSFRDFYKNDSEPSAESPEVLLDDKATKVDTTTPEEQIEVAYQAALAKTQHLSLVSQVTVASTVSSMKIDSVSTGFKFRPSDIQKAVQWAARRCKRSLGVSLASVRRREYFVTTSTFSQQAREFVRHLSQRVIFLSGQAFAGLMMLAYGIPARINLWRGHCFHRVRGGAFDRPTGYRR